MFSAIWTLILILLITGGLRGRFEISQVDVWAIILTLMVFWKSKGRLWNQVLPDGIVPRWLVVFKNKVRLRFENSPLAFVFGLGAMQLAIYFIVQLGRYYSFKTNAYDMTYVEQSIWSSAKLWPQVPLMFSSISRGGTYFGEHFSPILLTLVPFYKVWASSWHVFWVQPLLIFSGLLFCFDLAKKNRLSSSATLAVLIGYTLYQPLRCGAIFNFKEDAFFIPALFGAITSTLGRRWGLLALCSLIAFLTKENAAIPLVLLSVFIGVRSFSDRKKNLDWKTDFAAGGLLLVTSVAVFVGLNLFLSVVSAQAEKKAMIAERLAFLGATPKDIFANALFHPLETFARVIQHVFHKGALRYLWQVLLPFAPFVSASPISLGLGIIATLLVLANLLFTPTIVGFHYELILVPFLFSALISSPQMKKRNAGLVFILLCLCVYGRSPILALRESLPTREHLKLQSTLERIPDDLSVATQSDLMPHLHHRREIHMFRSAARCREDVIVLSFLPNLTNYGSEEAPAEATKIDGQIYTKIYEGKTATIWCKKDINQKCYDLKLALDR